MIEPGNTLKSKNDFECFLENIPSYLEGLAKIMNKEELDFSDGETVAISEHFIDMYEAGHYTLEERKKIVAYIGEAFRKRYEGKWFFTGSKLDSFAPNEPIVNMYRGGGVRYAPAMYIEHILKEKDPNYFNYGINYMQEMTAKKNAVLEELFGKKKKRGGKK